MKYFLLSLFLIVVSSCSFSNPIGDDLLEETRETSSGTNKEWTQGSDSATGVMISSGSEAPDENTASWSVSEKENESDINSSGSDGTVPVWTNNMEKDPEVQSIQRDIDAIFSDIEKGGK
ncbi:MAG: hypothetical protein ACD_78C00200G0001 [uncultured bacterium (gcode 4)]|uniref:Uncharacterized protein n=1 Tax=uncultured bacterium (gcode 4) TaxID=1234023 RepID=K1XY94_9BACT|nr:MAG: hypothetical protein ACD_78C00200G0001 [uncultured bacterium (gcode 4)]